MGIKSVTAGSDLVLIGITIPEDSTLIGITGTVGAFGAKTQFLTSLGYGAWLGAAVPLDDAATQTAYDTIWDTHVPKDAGLTTLGGTTVGEGASASALMDYQDDTALTQNFSEPGDGEISISDLLDIGDRPEIFFERQKWYSFWDSSARTVPSGAQTNQVVTAFEYIPNDKFRVRLRRPMRFSRPTAVMLGYSCPNMDTTENTTSAIPYISDSAEALLAAKYAEDVMEHLVIHGVLDADTDLDTTFANLIDYLEPPLMEMGSTANAFIRKMAMVLYGTMSFSIRVPGSVRASHVGTEMW